MARLARVVIAGMPHRITQRGNRRQQAFFHDEDYAAYVELMGEEQLRDLRNHAHTGRPLGDATFVERLEKLVGCVLRPRKRGQKTRFPKQPNQVLCPGIRVLCP